MIEFKTFSSEDYDAVCDFFVKLNQVDKRHINWNWARFEWMYEHPYFDKTFLDKIGLWWDKNMVVGIAIYDMYPGEACCAVLPEYAELYEDVLCYAYENLKDDSGLGIAIRDDDTEKIKIAEQCGFHKAEQSETIMSCSLDRKRTYVLKSGFTIKEFDPAKEAYEFAWLLWQGFDHGSDISEFERNSAIAPQCRPHINLKLSLAIKNEKGENVAYCCLWYDPQTDYAYIEPVCTIPAYRGMGFIRATLYEAMNRAMDMGAKKAYVISDQEFYGKLGLNKDMVFSFYRKNE